MNLTIDPTLLATVPFIIMLVEIVKRVPALAPATWAYPLFSLGFAFALVIPAATLWPPAGSTLATWWAHVALNSLMCGLTAAGMWSAGVKYVLPEK